MVRRTSWAIVIASFFAVTLYTTNGCGGTPTETFHLAALSGLVTDAVSGQPIGGATVAVTPSGGTPFTVSTGIDGRYSMTGLSTGNANVNVSAAGHQSQSVTKNLVDGSNTLDVQLRPATP
jgi:Carboxypeptidase regulatory-like domain